MPRLRWIHSTGAGIESFASRELAERGVIVTNSSGVYASAMAEYAVFGMVAIARDLRRLMAQQDERRWNHEPISGTELYGKRVGIVGYGGTGRYLATVCKALGMEVWATKRKPMLTTNEPLDRLLPPEGVNEMLAGSDYVVVTASLNSTSRHLLGEAEFRALKPGAGTRQRRPRRPHRPRGAALCAGRRPAGRRRAGRRRAAAAAARAPALGAPARDRHVAHLRRQSRGLGSARWSSSAGTCRCTSTARSTGSAIVVDLADHL